MLDDSKPTAIKRLHAAAPNSKILVLGLECDPVYANRALDAGADGYIAREAIDGTLPELLHRIAEGERRLVCLP